MICLLVGFHVLQSSYGDAPACTIEFHARRDDEHPIILGTHVEHVGAPYKMENALGTRPVE